jgi:UDP:flavonoid glycosyltransferase YjiC (YdhE family)
VGVKLKRVLYISGSVGLGHATRDVAIARSLRKLNSDVQIEWLSEEPATTYLKGAGETVLPEASHMVHGNKLVTDPEVYDLNVMRWMASMRKQMPTNAKKILEVARKGNYDLVVGDEAFDLTFEFLADPSKKTFPFVMMYDCFGVDQMNHNPKDMFFSWYINRSWVKILEDKGKVADRYFFVGELEDIQDKSLGISLPNRRILAEKGFDFVGNIIRFDPAQFSDKKEVRKRLGYDDGALVLVTKGGTNVGKSLLDLCIAAYPYAKKQIPDLRMVVVCGPSVDPAAMKAPEGVDVRGFEPTLYEHIAACDLVIAQGGHTTINETMALRKPFIVFPLEHHFDQLETVMIRCDEQGAGVKMRFYETTPQILGEIIAANIGKTVSYPELKTNTGGKAAEILNGML